MFPKSLGNILVSDSDDDSDVILGTTATDEDKIDELDIVDEDVQSRASADEELGEDEDQSDQVKRIAVKLRLARMMCRLTKR